MAAKKKAAKPKFPVTVFLERTIVRRENFGVAADQADLDLRMKAARESARLEEGEGKIVLRNHESKESEVE